MSRHILVKEDIDLVYNIRKLIRVELCKYTKDGNQRENFALVEINYMSVIHALVCDKDT